MSDMNGASPSDPPRLPRWLESYSRFWPWGLLTTVVLMGLAFLTNPTPDPAMPGLSVPASWRLPFEQPRIEPWPVSYTVGLWTTSITLPSLLLAGYRRFGESTPRGVAVWLVAVPALAMLAETSYCRFLLPQLEPASWNSPDYTVVCWFYCSSYVTFWMNVAQGVVGIGAVAAYGALMERQWASWATLIFGVLAVPIGIPPLVAAHHWLRGE